MNLVQVGLKKYTLQQLQPNLSNCMVVCIIIGKQNPRKIKSRYSSGEKAVWNFTVRDSPSDYINVSFWGSPDTIFTIGAKFQIGDVVAIEKPIVELRRLNDPGEKFHPVVTSPFRLSLNENEANLVLIIDGGYEKLRQIMHIPTKPIYNYTTLADIYANKSAFEGDLVDILVAINHVSEPRFVTTRLGESQVRNVTVFDHTNPGLCLSFWDPEMITRAAFWKPRTTILFMTDIKISPQLFRGQMNGSLSMRSIITENPSAKEADNLREYAKSVPLQTFSMSSDIALSMPDPTTIQSVMNIRQIFEKFERIKQSESNIPEERQFGAKIYAAVIEMDLDGFIPVISTRCVRCMNLIRKPSTSCSNEHCTVGNGTENLEPEKSFNIRVTISDQTGSLRNCRLNGKYAEQVLNCSVQDFLLMSEDQKCNLKWKYLLERCCLKVVVFCGRDQTLLTSILTCELADFSQYYLG